MKAMKKTVARILICVMALMLCANISTVNAFAEEHEHLCSFVFENDKYYSHLKCNVCGAYIVMSENGAIEVSEASLLKPGYTVTSENDLAEGTVVYVDTTGSENIVATIVNDPTSSSSSSASSSTIRSGYNVSSAINWAVANAYINVSTDSCAAYCSNVLYYGGGLVNVDRVNYVGELVIELLANGYGTLNDVNAYSVYGIQPGDILLVADPAKYTGNLLRYGEHCMYVTNIDYTNGILYYSQHDPVYTNKAVSFTALTSGTFARSWSNTSVVQFISMYK